MTLEPATEGKIFINFLWVTKCPNVGWVPQTDSTSDRSHFIELDKMPRVMLVVAAIVLATILSIVAMADSQLIAMHQLVVVQPAGDAVIRTMGYNNLVASPKVSIILSCTTFSAAEAPVMISEFSSLF
jgi:hypothetical protein